MATTRNDHIYRLFAKVVSLNIDGTATINFLRPVTCIGAEFKIPQDDFSLGDVIMFELAEFLTEAIYRERFKAEGEIVNV